MTQKISFFLLGLCFLLSACQKKIEIIEEKDENGKITATFERRVDDFAKHGFYKSYHEGGELFEEANYADNKLEGKRTLYRKSGSVETEELYINNQLQGVYKTFHKDGTLKEEGDFVDNAMKGVWKFYYPSGKIKEEVTFENSAENGPFKEYYENGKLKTEGQYKGGNYETGELKKYDEQGEHFETLNCEITGMGDVVFSKCTAIWKREG